MAGILRDDDEPFASTRVRQQRKQPMSRMSRAWNKAVLFATTLAALLLSPCLARCDRARITVPS
jgi:hypothetical protein